MMRPALVVAALLAGVGCGREEPPRPEPLPDASRVDLGGVDGALEGTLGGEPFHAADARFRVVRYPGRERVDLLFADRPIERCGLPLARAQTRFWLRVPGVTALVPGELADLQIHYERPSGRSFAESHRAIGRLEMTRATTEIVEGRVHACFADGAQSCVAGAFRATPCRGRVDGRTLREPPGLADEALEPLPEGGP